MIERIRLMNDWLYCHDYADGMEKDDRSEGFVCVSLPHANEELPYNYFDETRFQFVSCYRKVLPAIGLKPGQRAALRFEGVMASARVFLNGEELGSHDGGYTPFEFDVGDAVRSGKRNVVTVVVDSRELPGVPPFGGQIDYLTYGGIYRDVSLDIYEGIHVRNARVLCAEPLAAEKRLDVTVYTGNGGAPREAIARIRLNDAAGNILASADRAVSVPAGEGSLSISLTGIRDAALWSFDSPNLYSFACELVSDGVADRFETRVGFRVAEFRSDGFFLNGERVQLRGLNRHQSWPYVGYAMPRRAQERDADILKDELHVNIVRTSHYPQSIDFLNRCDEIGLLVFEEIPGWQHIGPESWQDIACANVGEMIRRDWNHPSIILWGVRINESQDDDAFYKRTNALAHELDPSRQTGGVRYFSGSSFLEDVYTRNDFSFNGGETVLEDTRASTRLDRDVPYLITEFNGHMFPTKSYDCEERQSEFALRHLRVQNAAASDPRISGAIGWCMFDYNTHNDFGAGDRICHHGVMDMFRIPKFAAWSYASQVDPRKEIVLKPVTVWARGERSVCTVFPLVILSNCDSIALRFGAWDPIPVTKRDGSFGYLPYPPFVITEGDIGPERLGAWGMKWEDATVLGYIDGKEVASCRLSKNPIPVSISLEADDTVLSAGEKDVTRFVVGVRDQCDNPLFFSDSIVDLAICGPARVQGPSRLVLRGGQTGFWIESNGTPGTIQVTASVEGLPAKTVTVTVR